MMLCKTPWLKSDYWCSDWETPSDKLFLCGMHFDEYFDVSEAKKIRLVAYDRPSKDRYCVEVIVTQEEDLGPIIDLDIDGEAYAGGFYEAFEAFLVRIHKRFGSRKLYVECEIK